MELHSLLQVRPTGIGKPLVLVVEDNEDSLVLLTQALELFHCSVVSARDGRTGLALAQTYQPDLVLLDVLLPDMHGLELVTHLRQISGIAAHPFIAVTALAKAEDRQQLLAAGCDDYITKPYILEDLEATIQYHLGELQALRSC
jgi:two-component system, cell cycle response regulator DivK